MMRRFVPQVLIVRVRNLADDVLRLPADLLNLPDRLGLASDLALVVHLAVDPLGTPLLVPLHQFQVTSQRGDLSFQFADLRGLLVDEGDEVNLFLSLLWTSVCFLSVFGLFFTNRIRRAGYVLP